MAQPIWNTPAGTIGTYPALSLMDFQLVATAVAPATSLTYILLSGSLPNGISITSSGLIYGTPDLVVTNETYSFAVRVTDNLGNIRDRTFSMSVSGIATPQITTPNGSILSTQDSIWVELPITYTNPKADNPVLIQKKEGELPPGLEINDAGVIRGYARAPIITLTTPTVITNASATDSVTNSITVTTTIGFSPGRAVVFTGTTFGDINAGQTYYVKAVLNSTTFTITATQNGPTLLLTSGNGLMTVTLPPVSTGTPTIRTYNFTLELSSPLGDDIGYFSITVINQNLPVSQGGPGKPNNSRSPVLLNTRPATYNLTDNDPYYGYYILPPVDPSSTASMGSFQSGEFFSFKMLGYDFDGNPIKYSFSGLPTGLTGDEDTGWITGYPALTTSGISSYYFSVSAYKSDAPSYASPFFNFSFNLRKDISGTITWITNSNLGQIYNDTISTLYVKAESDIELSYRLLSGSLPSNLSITSNGEIVGRVANQPTDTVQSVGDTSSYEFTVQAYSTKYPSVVSTKTFSLTVLQQFGQPTDTLYIKAAPSFEDRQILDTLLNNDTIIPADYLYRPNDAYFGKASSVIYEHAYGIYASDIQEYLAAITKNHYWRNITLGEIKTALAKDESGNVLYEVVYSQVIDNLINPQGISIQKEVIWPRLIDLGLGPWYTSITDFYTSWVELLDQQYYTSLTPGYARNLYPNSLPNMRQQIADVVGQEYDSKLLPLWMTSQQIDGNTLGYTPAWVIAYTKPGYAETVKNNIETLWVDPIGNPYTLNLINFQIDRFSVDKSATYNYDNNTTPPAWTGLPSASPTPNPLDSKDFYVLFPRQTILPNQTQYKY
jgi:hypothetical protein